MGPPPSSSSGDFQSQIDDLKNQMTLVKNSITFISQQLNSLTHTVTNIQSSVDTLNITITDISNRLDADEIKILNISNLLTSVDARTTHLESTVNTLSTSINNISTRLDVDETNITSLTSRVTILESQSLDQLWNSLKTLQNSAASDNNSSIDFGQTTLPGLSSAIWQCLQGNFMNVFTKAITAGSTWTHYGPLYPSRVRSLDFFLQGVWDTLLMTNQSFSQSGVIPELSIPLQTTEQLGEKGFFISGTNSLNSKPSDAFDSSTTGWQTYTTIGYPVMTISGPTMTSGGYWIPIKLVMSTASVNGFDSITGFQIGARLTPGGAFTDISADFTLVSPVTNGYGGKDYIYFNNFQHKRVLFGLRLTVVKSGGAYALLRRFNFFCATQAGVTGFANWG